MPITGSITITINQNNFVLVERQNNQIRVTINLNGTPHDIQMPLAIAEKVSTAILHLHRIQDPDA